MTSAAELFYTRRTRLGRGSSGFESDSVPDRISPHHRISGNRHHRHQRCGNGARRVGRLDLIGSDPLPRSRILSHRSSVQEHDSVDLDPFTSPSSPGSINSSENEINIRDRFRITGDDGLPGSVILARERLLQRLRGISLSGNRCSNRVSTSTNRRNFTPEDDFRVAGSRDRVSRTGMPVDVVLRDRIKRPPGLTKESLESLRVELFNNLDYSIQEAIPSVPLECSICLEAFSNGDKLFCLPCGHKFHDVCLVPWVRTCGDCPYCRACISKNSS
nr:probable E3 ubiquitin-protein ligase RHY1A [Ipomoea batatas]